MNKEKIKHGGGVVVLGMLEPCELYTTPSTRDRSL